MSAAVTGWWGSMVSLLPPPVAPWIRTPPELCAPPPPPLPLLLLSVSPPHAVRKLLPATAAAPMPEYLSSWRRENSKFPLRGWFTLCSSVALSEHRRWCDWEHRLRDTGGQWPSRRVVLAVHDAQHGALGATLSANASGRIQSVERAAAILRAVAAAAGAAASAPALAE